MDERTRNEQLSDEQLAEADAESDVPDADIEDAEPSGVVQGREPIRPDLGPEDIAEPTSWTRTSRRRRPPKRETMGTLATPAVSVRSDRA
jgi:hypothetical protein